MIDKIKRNKKSIVPLLGLIVIMVGLSLFMKYSGVTEAHYAQNEIAENGYYYNGDTWLTTQEYDELKLSLATRDSSLQTRSDLIILPKIQGDKLHIQYSFFSIEDYGGLNKTKDMPTWFNMGLSAANIVYILMFFSIVLCLLNYGL
jgi:hypothetical protein